MQRHQFAPARRRKGAGALKPLLRHTQQALRHNVAGIFQVDGRLREFDAAPGLLFRQQAPIDGGDEELDLAMGAMDVLVDAA
ncbi:hypothetical protein D9M73_276490 [compost metagenome]